MADDTRAKAPSGTPEDRAELVLYSRGAGRIALPAGDALVLGRDGECDVVVADPAVSRRHCRLLRRSGAWWLEDLGSQSGTRIDGHAITQPVPLAPGAWFQIGDSLVQVAAGEGAVPGALSGDPRQDSFLLGELTAALEALSRAEGLDEILTLAVDHALGVTACERGAVFLAGAAGTLDAAVARDRERGALPLGELLTRSLPRRALERRRPVVVVDTARELAAEELPASLLGTARRCVLCVPLPGAVEAVLYVDSSRPAPSFGAGELAILATLALHAGLALERADAARRAGEIRRDLAAENARLRTRLGAAPLGDSPAFERTLEMIRRLAPSDATVCLEGETGTGKEVLARTLHRLSPRAQRPFVVVDCGALPANLIESELFGHERGAFTGALQARPGRLREAHGGTVFLDEIGELPPELQPRLLRFLQERTVQPIGGRATAVDVRVIAATNRDLADSVRRETLRQDLYFRLAVLTVTVPALRERGTDVLLLAEHWLRAQGGPEAAARLGHDARRALLEHPWPGNVRELEHRLQRALLLAPGLYFSALDLGLGAGPASDDPTPDELAPLPEARRRASDRFERRYLEEALRRAQGSVSEAARLSGVSRQVIHTLLQRHGIDRERFVPAAPDGSDAGGT